jgi:predicted nucleic acid-binding Zn ribbon protein
MAQARRRGQIGRGRWQVERERCQIEDPVPRPPAGEARPIAPIVSGLLAKFGIAQPEWLGALQEGWAQIVGPAVAAHTRPGRLDRRRLIVFVDNSVWLGELMRYGRRQMLANLQKQLGPGRIDSVTLQLDPDGAASSGRARG